jgi:hypothetical protein
MIDLLFYLLFIVVFGYIIFYNIDQTTKYRKK